MNLKLINLFLFFLHGVLSFSQINSEQYYFSRYDRLTYNEDSIVKYECYANGSIRYIEYNPPGRQNGYFVRFYQSGNPSIVIQNLDRPEFVIENTTNYRVAGNVTTWYESGQVRSEYSLDSNGLMKADYVKYNTYGKAIIRNIYQNGCPYQGYFSYFDSDSTAHLNLYSQGECITRYYVHTVNESVDSVLKYKNGKIVKKNLWNVRLKYEDIRIYILEEL